MKLKLFLFAALFSLITFAGNAQEYKTGLGLRLGPFNGITVKHFLSQKNALEGIASFRWNGFIITGLYEWQKGIKGANGLDYFLGLGAHVGSINGNDYYKYYRYNYDNYRNHLTVIGADFIIGLEYTFKEAPFNIGLDWKPAIDFGNYGWWGDGLALSVRYTFK